MANLTTAQIERLTTMMDERYAREMEAIRAVAARTLDSRRQDATGGGVGDRGDEALFEIALTEDDAIVRQDIQDVRDIQAARKRLEAGTYGVCIDCDAPIAYERLLAYPTAKRCIQCQEQHERTQASRAGRGAS